MGFGIVSYVDFTESLRGLFEFNLFGSELDAYVKKQVADYREQAKSFGLAK